MIQIIVQSAEVLNNIFQRQGHYLMIALIIFFHHKSFSDIRLIKIINEFALLYK